MPPYVGTGAAWSFAGTSATQQEPCGEDAPHRRAIDEPNVARLRAALREVFDDPEIDGISAADLAGNYPAIQYVPPGSDYWIDILARLDEAFRYADVEAEVVHIEGIPIRVATPRMLYRMKRDTVRPQDRADAELLKQRFDVGDD